MSRTAFWGDLNTVQQKTGISNLYSSLWWEEIAKPYFPEYTDADFIIMWDEYKGNYQWHDLTDVMNKMKDEMKP